MAVLNTRRMMSGVFVATATVLAVATTAFACTTYRGSETVTKTGSSTAIGSNSGMTYCNGVTDGATASSGNSITVAVAPATCGGTSYQLPSNTYDVSFINNKAYTMPFSSWILDQANGDCMAVGGSTGTVILKTGWSITTGTASTSVTLPTGLTTDHNNPSGTRSGVCVSDTSTPMSSYGMEVPLKII